MIQEKKQWGPPNASRSPADKIILFCFNRSTFSCLICLLMDYSRLERSLSLCFHQNHVLHLFSVAPACNALCPLPARPPSCRIEKKKKNSCGFIVSLQVSPIFNVSIISYLSFSCITLACLPKNWVLALVTEIQPSHTTSLYATAIGAMLYIQLFQFNRHHFGFSQSQVRHMYLYNLYCLEGK